MDGFKASEAAKPVIEILKASNLTVAQIREILRYIDNTIEHNAVLK